MNNLSDEQLSSLLDGELDEMQCQEAIDVLCRDSKARKQWARFHLASDALHGNLPDAIDPNFASRVMAAIDDEPAILAPPPHQSATSTPSPAVSSAPASNVVQHPSSFSKRFAGLAVAASVAAMAVMGVETLYRDDSSAPVSQQVAQVNATQQSEFARLAPSQGASLATLASVKASGSLSTSTGAANTAGATIRPGVHVVSQAVPRRIDPRLHKYLINHSQQAARSNVQGIMPYARIVTYAGMHQQPVQR